MNKASDKTDVPECILGGVNIPKHLEGDDLFKELATLHAEAFHAVGEVGLSTASLVDFMAHDVSRLYVMRAGDNVNGFAVVRTVLDEAELLTIAVHPRLQNSGVGARLLEFIIDDLTCFGTSRLFLEVRADNIAALHLYANLGFLQTGRRSNYYRMLDGTSADAVTQTLVL